MFTTIPTFDHLVHANIQQDRRKEKEIFILVIFDESYVLTFPDKTLSRPYTENISF